MGVLAGARDWRVRRRAEVTVRDRGTGRRLGLDRGQGLGFPRGAARSGRAGKGAAGASSPHPPSTAGLGPERSPCARRGPAQLSCRPGDSSGCSRPKSAPGGRAGSRRGWGRPWCVQERRGLGSGWWLSLGSGLYTPRRWVGRVLQRRHLDEWSQPGARPVRLCVPAACPLICWVWAWVRISVGIMGWGTDGECCRAKEQAAVA